MRNTSRETEASTSALFAEKRNSYAKVMAYRIEKSVNAAMHHADLADKYAKKMEAVMDPHFFDKTIGYVAARYGMKRQDVANLRKVVRDR